MGVEQYCCHFKPPVDTMGLPVYLVLAFLFAGALATPAGQTKELPCAGGVEAAGPGFTRNLFPLRREKAAEGSCDPNGVCYGTEKLHSVMETAQATTRSVEEATVATVRAAGLDIKLAAVRRNKKFNNQID